MSDLIAYRGYLPPLPPNPIGGGLKRIASGKIDEFLSNAKKFLGQPYLWGGGHTDKTGVQPVDCSGLVLQAARLSGLNLDGTAAMQQGMGQSVSLNALQPGDLLFHGNPATHVGIYLGDGKAMHAPHTGAVVQVVDLKQYTYFDSARRVFSEAAGRSPAPQTPPTAAAPAKPLNPGGACTAGRGETLWRIAERTLGSADRWREIYDLNRNQLVNPNLVFPGMILQLPGGNQAAPTPPPATSAPVTARMPVDELRRKLVAMRDQVRALLGQVDGLARILAGLKPTR